MHELPRSRISFEATRKCCLWPAWGIIFVFTSFSRRKFACKHATKTSIRRQKINKWHWRRGDPSSYFASDLKAPRHHQTPRPYLIKLFLLCPISCCVCSNKAVQAHSSLGRAKTNWRFNLSVIENWNFTRLKSIFRNNLHLASLARGPELRYKTLDFSLMAN